MDELDQKLENILESYHGGTDKAVEQIKSAFQEAGYEKVISANLSGNPSDWYMKLNDWVKTAHQVKPQEGGFRTGKEWFDRATESFRLDLFARGVTAGSADYNRIMGQFSRVARRAAGLEEN